MSAVCCCTCLRGRKIKRSRFPECVQVKTPPWFQLETLEPRTQLTLVSLLLNITLSVQWVSSKNQVTALMC